MSVNKTTKWPLLSELSADTVSDAVRADGGDVLPITFDRGETQEIGALMINPNAFSRGARLGQFSVRGVTVPPDFDVVIDVDPFSADGSYGTVSLTKTIVAE